MMYFRKDQAKSRNEGITSYSPIARSLLSSSMDPAVRERVKKKFDISFVLACSGCKVVTIILSQDMSGQYSVVADQVTL